MSHMLMSERRRFTPNGPKPVTRRTVKRSERNAWRRDARMGVL